MTQARRERNMDAKRSRIFHAASELFAEHGFGQVTTQSIADRADVAAGTLFRYAQTKADLLVMVYNEELQAAISAGRAAAAEVRVADSAVFALVLPVLQAAQGQPLNSVQYQRELLFGSDATPHRAAGLALVSELEEAVAEILLRGVPAAESGVRLAAERAARVVFAALHLALAQASTGTHPDKDPAEELRAQIALIVRGFQASVLET